MAGGCSCEQLLAGAVKLKEEMNRLLPVYADAVKRLSHTPEEFDREGCAAWVDALVEKVAPEYRRWEAARPRAAIMSTLAVAMMGLTLKAVGQQPLALPPSPVVAVAILPDGTLRICLTVEYASRADVAVLPWSEFEAVAMKLKEKVLRGEAQFRGAEEVPALLRRVALGLPIAGV
ncbi:MAG: hypothetical protein Q8P22_09080 [Chloroflexota bacterium]|nr:hypothetical protein [Chloroflexota bacterium]